MRGTKKILIVFGTRPEAIKLAPLINLLKKDKQLKTFVCFTGQHRDMVKNILELFSIKVDYDLKIMKKNQDLFQITAKSLLKLKSVLDDITPDLVIVQGDTTTAFTASLASFYKKIKIAHVEAGLRSHNKLSPYPEEINRKFISALGDIHFAPSDKAAANLLKDGLPGDSVFITGNTVVDAADEIKKRFSEVKNNSAVKNSLKKYLPIEVLEGKYVLVTLHRREKFGKEFKSILTLLKNNAASSGYNFVYPVHLNPNVALPAKRILGKTKNIFLLPPQEYINFTYLMSRCYFIITDSGGIQEECYTFKKPVVVIRDVTERREALDAGYAFLTGLNEDKIKKTISLVDEKLKAGFDFFTSANPFGSGRASEEIVKIIKDKLV